MTDHDALLRAVLLNPLEDTPRLMYADWLDENAETLVCPGCSEYRYPGKRPHDTRLRNPIWTDCSVCCGTGVVSDGRRERGEFIRLQISRQTHLDGSKEAVREQELLNENVATWSRPMGNTGSWHFTRGFVETVELLQSSFTTYAAEIFASHPVLTMRLIDVTVESNLSAAHRSSVGEEIHVGSRRSYYTSRTYDLWFHPMNHHSTANPVRDRRLIIELTRLYPRHVMCAALDSTVGMEFASHADARDALSHAAVNVGRALNNLPLLYHPNFL